MRKVGIDLRRDCHITSALICRTTGDAIPTGDQIDHCRPNLLKTIEELDPEVIIPLGTASVQSLLATVYKEDDIGGVMRWAGFTIPCQKINAWIVPTFHPRYVMAQEKNPVPNKLFYKHLKTAADLCGRPWSPVPNYKKEVELLYGHREAAVAVLEMLEAGLPIAFDYETTCLKPEYEGAAIVSCAMSNGERTIAYPWIGDVVEASRQVFRSKLPKIASNLKFEERWTRWQYGRGVRAWAWDTMNVAHCLDNRPNTTSIKFQAFIHLGTEAYDEHIKPFLRAKKGQRVNQILQEIDLDQLLTYNGLDAILEYKVAMIQAKIAGMEI